MEVGRGIHHVGLLQKMPEFWQQPFVFRDLTDDVHLVVLWLQMELLPHVEQEVEGIVGIVDLKAVTELKTVLLETEEVELSAVEIPVELVAMSSETALMEMVPDGGHRLDELHLTEAVGQHAMEIFVDGKETDGFQLRQYVIENDTFCGARGEGMVEEHFHVFFLELFDGHEHGRRIYQYLQTFILWRRDLEGLAQIGCHGDAALHDIGLIIQRALLVGSVERREGKRVLSDAYDHLFLSHHSHILATHMANSPAAIRARRIFVCLSLSLITGCKDTKK